MKVYLPALVFGGLIIMMLLQSVLFVSTSLQSQGLQKQLTAVSKKVDALQYDTDNVLDSLVKLNNESSLTDLSKTQADLAESTAEADPNNVLSAANLAQTLGAQTSANGKIRLKTGWKNMDAYDTNQAGGHIIGQIVSGQDYPIVTKQASWYQINLDTLTIAWVQAQFVYETN
jgi:hypothetical protein